MKAQGENVQKVSWGTAYRGPLLLHASMGKRGALLAEAPLFKKYIPSFNSLPFGAIIGQVTLDDVMRIDSLSIPKNLLPQATLEENAFGDYTPGRRAWLLSYPILFQKPILIKGALGLWHYSGPLS